MSMLQKLQRKTLVWTQIVGYAVTLFVGTLIGLVVLQFYADVTPALEDQTDVFAEDASVVSKIPPSDESLIWDHSLLEFSPEEIKELEGKPYVASISEFQVATFKVFATVGGRNLGMSTAMFLESIPSEYMDVDTAQWSFEPGDEFVPIVVPEDYLNLFNLGFAQSQGLPALTQSGATKWPIDLNVSGRGSSKSFVSQIVGFSNKVNSILVPQEFLVWANAEFGNAVGKQPNRLLVKFSDPADQQIAIDFKDLGYTLNEDRLEYSKVTFFFKMALMYMFGIAMLIVIMSVAFVLLSIRLIIHKNKELVLNVYHLGYRTRDIAWFYQKTISAITMVTIGLAVGLSVIVREAYLSMAKGMMSSSEDGQLVVMAGLVLFVFIGLVYNVSIVRRITQVVKPAQRLAHVVEHQESSRNEE